MPPPTLPPASSEFDDQIVTYEDVRIVITPEAPDHHHVEVRDDDDHATVHAVESVVINTASVALDGPIWFIQVDVDVGVPLNDHRETVWVWA